MLDSNMAEKAMKHYHFVNQNYAAETVDAVKNTRIYYEDTEFVELPSEVYPCKFELVPLVTQDAVYKYNQSKTAVLNFADFKKSGGLFLEGAVAQEEALCHASNLFNILNEFRPFYAQNSKMMNRGLYQNRALYSPGVVFDDGAGKVCKADVITCAAPNKGPGIRYGTITERENFDALFDRIKFVLDIAADQGVDTLILGAYGCGVFKQDPTAVALLFTMFLKEYNPFKKVVFAIPLGPNYMAFKEYFESARVL